MKIKRSLLLSLVLVCFVGAGAFILNFKRPFDPSWMAKQIDKDLTRYPTSQLSSLKLKKYFNHSLSDELLVYYQIKDGQLYFKPNWDAKRSYDRLYKTTRLIEKVVSTCSMPDMEFILTIHDGLREDTDCPESLSAMPIFCYAKTNEGGGILFPDPLSDNFARRGRKIIARSFFRPKYQWRNKQEKAFWRGGTTGIPLFNQHPYAQNNWYLQPRSQLSLLSHYYPDEIDAGFTSYPGVKEPVVEEMVKQLGQVNWTRHKNHLLYKYLIIPDGNTCTYPRYYLALFSNSVAFKQNSQQVQWFYSALEPFKHYVPIAYDFSDLPEKIQWAKTHDKEVKKISKCATKWAKENLSSEQIEKYVQKLLLSYSKKQKTQVELLPDVMTFKDLKRD